MGVKPLYIIEFIMLIQGDCSIRQIIKLIIFGMLKG